MAAYRAANPEKYRQIKAAFNDRHRARVRELNRTRMNRWYRENREKALASARAAYVRAPEKMKSRAIAYLASPRGKQKALERRSTPRGMLDNRIRSAIYQSLAGAKAGRRWETLVGYSLDDLHSHLERQFLKGMSWQNMGEWHVDHILAKSTFSYDSPDDAEFKSCWALTNLRPLWAGDNLRKSARRTLLI